MKKLISMVFVILFLALIWLPLHIVFGAFAGAVDAFEDLKTGMEK